jgi:hypothetical protein
VRGASRSFGTVMVTSSMQAKTSSHQHWAVPTAEAL